MLKEMIEEFGPSSETNGLLGRIYKDRWEIAKKAGQAMEARGFLRAGDRDLSRRLRGRLARRLSGHQCRHPDGDAGQARSERRPTSSRSCAMRRAQAQAERRLLGPRHAARARGARPQTWTRRWTIAAPRSRAVREAWEPETTARNLRLIRETRTARGEDAAWIGEIEASLKEAQDRLANPQPATA